MSRPSSRSGSQDRYSQVNNPTEDNRSQRSESHTSERRQSHPSAKHVVMSQPTVIANEPEAVPIDPSSILEEVDSARGTSMVHVGGMTTPNPTTSRVPENIRRDEYGNILVDDNEDVGYLNSPANAAARQSNRSSMSLFGMGGPNIFKTTFHGNPGEEPVNHNSTFHRTKSIGMMLVHSVVDTATLQDSRIQSKFQSWNRHQLIDLLIVNNIELRGETSIRTSSLRELAEELFKGKATPPKPTPATKDELTILEHYVLVVQNRWVEKLEQRRFHLADIAMQAYVQSHEVEDDFDYAADMEAIGGDDTVEVPIDMVEEDYMDEDELMDQIHIPGEDEPADRAERGPYEPVEESELGAGLPASALATPTTTRARDRNRSVSFREEPAPITIEPKQSFFQAITRVLSPKSKPAASQPKREKKTLTYTKSIHVPKKAVEFLDLEWKPPDLKKALKFIDFFHPRKGGKGGLLYDYMKTTTGRHCCLGFMGEQCDILHEGQMSEFAVYGPGVTNYFKFLKWCYWLFVVLTIITLPCLVINFYGPYQYNGGLSELSMTTVGNLAQSTTNATSRVVIPICRSYGGYDIDCTMSKYTLGQVYSWTDVIVVAVILLAYIWLTYFEKEEERHLNKNTLFASQYTIMVTNLPPTITEDEIKHHFQEIAKNYPIAQMSVAYDNEVEINLCRERGNLIRKKKRTIHEHRYYTTVTKKRYLEEKNGLAGEDAIQIERLKFFRAIRDIDNKIKRINKNLNTYGDKPQIPLVAFITFNDDIASNIILNQYTSMSSLKYYLGNHRFRIKGVNDKQSYLLRVYPAPEPSTIIWENLRYKATSRLLRRSISSMVAGLMVFLSIVVTLGAKYFSIAYYKDTGASTQTCPAGFNNLPKSDQQDLVELNPDAYTHCYCSILSDISQARDPLCRSYLQQRLSAQFFQFFSSAIVLMMNAAIEAMTHITAKFDRHHSEDSRNESVFIRLFILKYINTGAIFLIDNNYSVLQAFFGIQSDNSQEFTPTWYQSVGVSILLVQLGNVFTAHGEKLYSYFNYMRKIRRAVKDPKYSLTQDELNKTHMGPDFKIAFNYAQILSTLFVCLTFSTGLPLLYPIAAANFFVFYSVDKFLFVRCYRNPPRWGSKVASQVSGLIPIVCILHLCMSIWVITDPYLFSSEHETLLGSYVDSYIDRVFGVASNISYRLHDSQSFRLFIFALIITAFLVLRFIVTTIGASLSRVVCNFRCCFGKDTNTSLDQNDVTLVTYSRAIQRNLIKGLATYNILQNPLYKEDFGITWKFAVDHDHVRSIRFDQGGAIDEDDDVAKAERLNRERNNAIGLSVSPHIKQRFFGTSSSSSSSAPKKNMNRKRVANSNKQASSSGIKPPNLNSQDSFMARQRILLEAAGVDDSPHHMV